VAGILTGLLGEFSDALGQRTARGVEIRCLQPGASSGLLACYRQFDGLALARWHLELEFNFLHDCIVTSCPSRPRGREIELPVLTRFSCGAAPEA
jgi:hypothetical protein